MDNFRIGRISSIDFERGMVQVLYNDRSGSVTKSIPVLNFNGEYKMPAVDDMVLVLHMSNGTAMGIVMGSFWNDKNRPAESGEGLYRKELGKEQGEAFIRYDSDTKTITIKADAAVNIVTENGTYVLGGE